MTHKAPTRVCLKIEELELEGSFNPLVQVTEPLFTVCCACLLEGLIYHLSIYTRSPCHWSAKGFHPGGPFNID